MVLGDVVSDVFTTRAPINMELLLAYPVPDPMKAHVDGFGAAELHVAGGEADGGGVVDLDGGGRLGMAHFFEGNA